MTSPYHLHCLQEPIHLLLAGGHGYDPEDEGIRLIANADVAGIGVLVGLTFPAFAVLILITVYFFFAVDPHDDTPGAMKYTKLDTAFLDWFRNEKRWAWQRWRRDPEPIQKIILAFSDAQLVNAFSLLFSEYTLGWTIDAYHWQILVQCVWFASATHLATIPILKQQLHKEGNEPLVYIRAFLMTVIWGLLVASLIPTGHPQWLYGSTTGRATLGSPALCFFNYDFLKTDDDRMSGFGIIWLGWSISLVSITYLRRLAELVPKSFVDLMGRLVLSRDKPTSVGTTEQTSVSTSSLELPTLGRAAQQPVSDSQAPLLPISSPSSTQPHTPACSSTCGRNPCQAEKGQLPVNIETVTPSTNFPRFYRLMKGSQQAISRLRDVIRACNAVVTIWEQPWNYPQNDIHPLLVIFGFFSFGIREATHTVWRLLGSFIWHIVWLFMMMMWNLNLLIYNKWFFNPAVEGDHGDNEWTFGQTMPLFLLILPAMSIVEALLEKKIVETETSNNGEQGEEGKEGNEDEKEGNKREKVPLSRWVPRIDNGTKELTHDHSTRITVFLMFEFAMLFGLLATINYVDVPQNAAAAAGNGFVLPFLVCLVTAPLGFTYLIHLGDVVQRSQKLPTILRCRKNRRTSTSAILLRSIVAVVVGLGIGAAISFYFCQQYKEWLELIHDVEPLDSGYFLLSCYYDNVAKAYYCP